MANLRIVAKNQVDHPSCVLSCTATPTLPLDNLKNYQRGRIARIPANPAFEIKGTYGGDGIYASMAALMRVNLEPAATWRFQGYSDAAWTNQVVDTTTLTAIDSATLGDLDWGVEPLGSGIFDPFYGQKWSLAWFARTLILSWKITITDTTNSEGVVDISRVWVGDYFELAYNPSFGMRMGWKENSEQWETDGGGPHVDAAVPYRVLSFDLENIPEADRAKWMDLLRYCGMRRDVMVSVYPAGTGEQLRDYTLDALIAHMPDMTTVALGRDTTNITLREV